MTNLDRVEEAKKRMEWDEYREPTLLEYLRYYRGGDIGEVHILAVIAIHAAEEGSPIDTEGTPDPAQATTPKQERKTP